MKPISPVLPGSGIPEVTYAKDQPQYLPLPAVRADDGTVVTRWRLSWRERLQALFRGDVYLVILTFHQPLQPVLLSTQAPLVTETVITEDVEVIPGLEPAS